MTPVPEERDPHFIGWYPMPGALAKFLFPYAIGSILGGLILAGWIAWMQKSPGNGTWEDRTVSFEGIAAVEPYAMLRTISDGTIETILLVEEGKHGAGDRVRAFAGKPVRVSGTLLSRDGLRMLELEPGEASITPTNLPAASAARLRDLSVEVLGNRELFGEIVDSKCYLGAMKPGVGKTHKGCAILCLRGGIPPLFVARDEAGTRYLLMDAQGNSLPAETISLAGDPITVTGTVERRDNLLILKCSSTR